MNGCYAESGPVMLAWDKVDRGKGNAVEWDEFLNQIRTKVYKNQLWRHNIVGDLVGQHNVIDTQKLDQLVQANRGKCGFAYTHYPVGSGYEKNLEAIRKANENGFTINLSADCLSEADELYGLGAPVVCVLDEFAPDKVRTPAGHHVIACPAEKKGVIDCARCGLCQKKDRKVIVGFHAHGARRRTVNRLLTVLNN
jgi:hypothetical protein